MLGRFAPASVAPALPGRSSRTFADNICLRWVILNATIFAKIADTSQPGQGGRIGFVRSVSEGVVIPLALRILGFRPQKSRFDDAGETMASFEWLIERTPDCDFQPVRKRGKELCERSDAPNPYKLALGLLKHPNRQLSGAGDRGRWAN